MQKSFFEVYLNKVYLVVAMRQLFNLWKIGLKKGLLGVFILLLLREKPMHGFELAKEIERVTGGTLKVKPKVLYPILQRMVLFHLVERVRERSPVGPPRYIYKLTRDGELFLREVILYYTPIVRALIKLARQTARALEEAE